MLHSLMDCHGRGLTLNTILLISSEVPEVTKRLRYRSAGHSRSVMQDTLGTNSATRVRFGTSSQMRIVWQRCPLTASAPLYRLKLQSPTTRLTADATLAHPNAYAAALCKRLDSLPR